MSENSVLVERLILADSCGIDMTTLHRSNLLGVVVVNSRWMTFADYRHSRVSPLLKSRWLEKADLQNVKGIVDSLYTLNIT